MSKRLSEHTFEIFRNLISAESGLHIQKNQMKDFEDKLSMRMDACEMTDFDRYLNYIQFNPNGIFEKRELLNSLTIGETFFFRNRHQFDALTSYVIPMLVKKRMSGDVKGRSIRIWCAGCSGGEEPYSLAITLAEYLPDFSTWHASILATDINSNSIAYAKKGFYFGRSLQHVPEIYLKKYFAKEGRGFRVIDPKIKNIIKFEQHNLAKSTFTLPEMRDLDIIFCRNVLIYFDKESTKQVIENFTDSLGNDGFLFIGHSETLWGISNSFSPIELPGTFIYQKKPYDESIAELPQLPILETPPPLSSIDDILKPLSEDNEVDFEDANDAVENIEEEIEQAEREFDLEELSEGLEAYKNQDYEKAFELLNTIQETDNVDILLAKGTMLANIGELEDALKTLESAIKIDILSTEAYYLRGTIFSRKKSYEAAIEEFRKALYADDALAICYFHIANLLKLMNKKKDATREYMNCLEVLRKKEEEDVAALTDGITNGILKQSVQRALEEIEDQTSCHREP